MKTKILLFMLVSISLGACKKEGKLEVQPQSLSEQTEQWSIVISYPQFSSTIAEVEKKCLIYNEEMEGLVKGIQAAFIEQAKESIQLLDSAGYKQVAPYELFIQDSVFLGDQNFISVLVSTYEMLGGANGIQNFYGVNYDIKNQKFLKTPEILKMEKSAEINALLKENLKDPEKCFTFEAPTITNLTALNFTQTTVHFTYGKYILGPGACGSITISIPREKMIDMLKI